MGSFSLRRTFVGIVGAGFILALLVPSIALAANTATFSSRVPISASWTTSTRPTISVTVHDRYGIRGTGAYSVTIDGKAVSVTASYLVSGSWNPLHPDYSRVRLTGRPATALAAGTHKVTVKTHDLKSHDSSTSWSFTVKRSVTFSSVVPVGGSSDDEPRPAISVNGYAVYGAKGSSKFTMSIDGSPVTPLVTYSTKYTKFKVAARALASDLGVGLHTVAVSATDLKGNTGSYTWSITVLAPPILPMPNSLDLNECAGCHSGYPTAHPMTACAACHSATAPSRPDGTPMRSYGSADRSAHTVNCVANPACHRGGGIFPHVLDSDCARCHTGSYPGIPVGHSTSVEQYHQSESAFCVRSGCHVASMTTEHYRRTVGGVAGAARLTCDTCHKSTDPRVQAAIASRSTACESCHGLSIHTSPHAVTRTDTCAAASCHGSAATDLATIHGSCAVCHADTASAATKAAIAAGDTSCANCHGFSDHTSLHVVTRGDTCAASACHGSSATSLTTIHASCATCHAASASAATKAAIAAGNKDCANCHGFSDHKALHVVTRDDTCGAIGCHGSADTNLTTIHSSCATCHASTAAAATKAAILAGNPSCANCHGFSDHTALHAVVRTDTCASCHVRADTNLVTIHKSACATCHDSADVTVSVAISSGRTACLECHAEHNLNGVHVATPATQTISINGAPYGEHRCSECHSPLDLRTLHANNCNACHTANFATTLTGPWTKGCVQGGCHTSGSTKPMHKTIDTSHTVTIVSIGALYKDCTTGVCHTGGYDVAKIHAPKLGCATCHGGAKVPTLDCSTVGCHDKTHDLETAHRATPRTDTIAINDVSYFDHACSECHSPLDLRTLHGAGNASCATCHTVNVNTTLGGTWGGGCVQGGCHAPAGGFPMHSTTAASHATSEGVQTNCGGTTCHGGAGGIGDLALIHSRHGHTALPNDGCSTCHSGSGAAIGNCSNTGCHPNYPTGHSHPATPATETITIHGSSYTNHGCAECHPGELDAIHDGGSQSCEKCHDSPRDSFATWNKTCAQGNCHTGTMPEKHATINSSHDTSAGVQTNCGGDTCHGGTGGIGDLALIHSRHGHAALPNQGCPTCHSVGGDPIADCATADCHPNYPIGHSHPATPATETITIGGASYPDHGCAECHPGELDAIHGGGPESCDRCHPTPRTSFTKWNGGCAQGDCHTGMMPAKHANIIASHNTSDGVQANCGGTGCHGGTDGIGDLALIHSRHGHDALPNQGCPTCHSDSGDPIGDCSTTDCHPNYPNGHSHPVTPDPQCVLCHAGTQLTSIMKSGAVSATHADCDTCHSADAPSWAKDAIAAAVSSKTPSTCADCHKGLAPRHDFAGLHAASPESDTISILGLDYPNRVCSDCHSPLDLRDLHGVGDASCVKCHTSDGDTALGGVDWLKGCVQGDCHKDDTPLKMHASVDTSHTLLAVPADCVKSGCHVAGGYGTDAAALHSQHGGCAACHDGARVAKPTLKCDSTNCHPNYPNGHAHPVSPAPAQIVINSLTYGPFACSTCHAGELDAIHGSDSCVKCHPTPRDTFAPTTGVVYSNSTCVQAGCHVSAGSFPMHATANLTSAHTNTVIAPTCSTGADDCHAGGTDIAAIHNVAKTPNKCLTCHDSTGKAVSTCATTGCHGTGDKVQAATGVHTTMGGSHVQGAYDNCNYCHYGCQDSGCHQSWRVNGDNAMRTDLAGIHAVNATHPELAGCSTCHTPGSPAIKDCAACHNLSGMDWWDEM